MRRFRPLVLAAIGLTVIFIAARPSLFARPVDPVVASAVVGGAFGGTETDQEPITQYVRVPAPPMTLAAAKVWLKLQEKVAFSFPNETPLQDVLKYVRQSTVEKDDFPSGIPIYVDPQGLRGEDKNASSPVMIDLEGVPLATSLTLALNQLGLVYRIHEDGILFITGINSESEDVVKITNLELFEQIAGLRAEVRALRNEIGRRDGSGPLGDRPAVPQGSLGGMR